MTIIGTFQDSSRRRIGQAVGMGTTESEALAAVLESARWFRDENQILELGEHIRVTLATATSDTLEADFEEDDCVVRIYW